MNNSEDMEIEKLKVADLRHALQERGLDSKGTKPILVQRLKVSKSFVSSDFQVNIYWHQYNRNLVSIDLDDYK